jgi:hypothetical protein
MMMVTNKMRLLVVCVAITALSASVSGHDGIGPTIQTFNFDDLSVGNIDDSNLGGVTITSADGSTRVVSNEGIGYRSPFNAVTNTNFLTRNPLVLTFDLPVSSVTLTGGDTGGDRDQFMVIAFDELDNVLASETTPWFGGNDLDPQIMVDFFELTLTAANIISVEVRAFRDPANPFSGGIGIDDLIVESPVEMPVDVMPGGCPNLLDTESEGVLSVAILGPEDLCGNRVKPESVRLRGVAPLRSRVEDVSRPVVDPQDLCDCTTEDGDGYEDLVLEFDIQEIVDTLGDFTDQEVRILGLTGELKDGTLIAGKDCVVILCEANPDDLSGLGGENPLSLSGGGCFISNSARDYPSQD